MAGSITTTSSKENSIVKYTIPVASIAIGTGWNYASTKAVAKIATKHFKQRTKELANDIGN